MPKINIDEIVETIEVRVGGKDYSVDDIPRATVREMSRLGNKSDTLERAIKEAEERLSKAKTEGLDVELKNATKAFEALLAREDKEDSSAKLATLFEKVMSADKGDFQKLGLRKLTMLVQKVMGTINEELDPKNVQKAVVTK